MVTGMWPPTNDMLRRFSTDTSKNAEGWIGGNWRDKGYDVHAFFPEFPDYPGGGLDGCGDFRIDYRSVSADFWRVAEALKPRAIVTFSAAAGRYPRWILERVARNLDSWRLFAHCDAEPEPCPPDPEYPANAARRSTLPLAAIVDAVCAARIYDDVAGFEPPAAIVQDDAGRFVSEFIGYHGLWYQALNADPNSPDRCVAAGHVHVGTPSVPIGERRCPIGPGEEAYADSLERAVRATEITLECVIDHVAGSVAGG